MAETYGLQPVGSPIGAPEQTQALKDALNKQSQTPYATQNGMNQTSSTTTKPASPTQLPSSFGTSTGTSPVTANGKINPVNAPPPQPQTTTTFATKPAPAAPAPGSAPQPVAMEKPLQVGATGYQPAPGQAPQAPGSVLPQMNLDGNRLQGGAYPSRQDSTTYNPGEISQWGGGLNPQVEQMTQDALVTALQGGGGLPVAQLRGMAQDDAFAMRDNELAAGKDAMAASGRLGGGYDLAQQANARQSAVGQALGAYRNIDIQDALARNEFGLKGISMGNDFLNSQLGRGINNYQAGLAGQQAREQTNLNAAQQNLNGYQADIGAYLGNRGLDINQQGAKQSYITDLLRIMEQARGNDQQTALGWGGLTAQQIMGL
jgi:hypothetical protein